MTDVGPSRFPMLSVDEAPKGPGIYAWYSKFRASPHDWAFSPGPAGTDEATSGFFELVRRHAQQFEPLLLSLYGSGAYGAKWAGSLRMDFPFREDQKSDPGGDQPAGRLWQAIQGEDARRLIATMLEFVTPYFSTPLYIGVAANLRERLVQHRSDYSKTYEYIQKNPQDKEQIKEKGGTFGARAAARDIAIENLEAWTIDLTSEEQAIPASQLKDISEDVEWLLHRIYSPILGRR